MNAMLAFCLLVTSCVTLSVAKTSVVEPGELFCSETKCTVMKPEVTRDVPEGDIKDDIKARLPAGRDFFRKVVSQTSTPTHSGHFSVSSLMSVFDVMEGIGGVASVISDIVGLFLPNEEHEEIMREFGRVQDSIQNVRDDIKALESKIEWGITTLQYQDCVNVITTAINRASEIPGSTDAAEKTRRQQRLVIHAQNAGLQMHLDTLFNGVIGRNGFTTNILDSYYTASKGHRPNMIKLASRLMGLLAGGLAAQMAYEAIVNGHAGVSDMVRDYDPHMKLASTRVNDPVNRCTTNFKAWMQADLELTMREKHNSPNREHVNLLFSRIREKYDWFLHVSLVYSDVSGFNNHIYSGYAASKLHYPESNKKCAINFYLTKTSSFRHSGQIEAARTIVRRHDDSNAQTTYERIQAELGNISVTWWGFACIKRYVGLEATSIAGTRMIWEVGSRMTRCLLLR